MAGIPTSHVENEGKKLQRAPDTNSNIGVSMDDILDINTLFGPLPVASVDLPVDNLLELMNRRRVGSACTLSTLGVLLDPAVGNSATRAACSEHSQLIPAATLNPTLFLGDVLPLQRLKTDGFKLVRFFPAIQGWQIRFAPFHSLIQNLATTNLPVMIDIEGLGMITDLMAALKGVSSPVILSGVDSHVLAEVVTALRTFPNWHIEISRMLAPGCVQAVVDAVGSERVLFGTGAPSQPIASVLYALQYAGLGDADRKNVLGMNARKILSV